MITVRGGRASDRAALDGLLEAWGMGVGTDPAEFLIAECDGAVVGAARTEELEGKAWLRPIAVAESAQRRGVGSTLIRELLARNGTLHCIARGASAAFYARLGFTPVSWEATAETLRTECEQCPDAAECCPVPMVGGRSEGR